MPHAWGGAALESLSLLSFTHVRPDFGVTEVETRGERHPVHEEVALTTPFCRLTRFRREGGENDPKVLLVAPMSGHFATLLRGTLRTLVRDHQVYLTDWVNARDVPLEAGVFGLEAYTRHLVDFARFLGEDCHIVAVCQPTVSALAATAVLAMEGADTQPQSLTLMAGPIDVRISPNGVNKLANDKPLAWFSDNLISTVPAQFPGRGPQGLSGLPATGRIHEHERGAAPRAPSSTSGAIAPKGRTPRPTRSSSSIDEYLAVMDMTADFYLETIDQVFQRCLLPQGRADLRRPEDRHPRHPQDVPADRRGREGRHLLDRADAGGAGPVLGPAALHEVALPAGRRRPLRGVQRQALGGADLPGAAQPHPGEPLTDWTLVFQRARNEFARQFAPYAIGLGVT